jgi:hypothetical protein
MKHILSLAGVLVLVGSMLPSAAWSQNAPAPKKQDADILIIEDDGDDILIIEEEGSGSIEDLREEIDRLADEIDDMRDIFGTLRKNVNVTGYGETHFNVPIDNDPGRPNEFDAHRFVIGVNARLADWIFLSAEIDYEHAAQELEFEMGYLDFLLDPKVNFRVGTVLIPVGFLNEYHEPTLFWTVERPQFQSRIIPTSWNGTGGGFFGTFGNFLGGMNYRVYAVNSLDSVNAGGGEFKASSGIRSGRLLPDHAIAEDIAITGRVEFSNLFSGFQLGGSFYTGETTHGSIEQGGRTTVLEADIKYRLKWFEMNASFANIHVGNAAEITNAALGANGNIASNILGYNIQAGIHWPQLLGKSTSHDVVTHFMYEFIDTQNQMQTGLSQATGSSGETDVYTTGVTWIPSTTNVSLKMDYTHQRFLDGTSTDQVNFGMAYMFF